MKIVNERIPNEKVKELEKERKELYERINVINEQIKYEKDNNCEFECDDCGLMKVGYNTYWIRCDDCAKKVCDLMSSI